MLRILPQILVFAVTNENMAMKGDLYAIRHALLWNVCSSKNDRLK